MRMVDSTPKTWVLLRGLGREILHWNGFEKVFAAHLKVTTAPIDLPGVGTHNQSSVPLSIKAIMEDVRSRAPKDETSGIGLLAISLGGMVAYQWAVDYPEEISKLVLINSSFNTFSPFYRRLQPTVWPKFLTSSFAQDPVERERQILEFVSRRPERFSELSQKFAEGQKQRPVKLISVIRQLAAATIFHPRGDRPAMKTLILGSTQDELCHPSCSLAMASHWGAPIVFHPTAGHDLTLDEPEWVANTVSQFLKSKNET